MKIENILDLNTTNVAEAAALGEDVPVIDFFSAKILFPFFFFFSFGLASLPRPLCNSIADVFIVVVGFALRGETPQLPNPKISVGPP